MGKVSCWNYNKWTVEREAQVDMRWLTFDIHLQRLPWTSYPGHDRVVGKDLEEGLGAQQPLQSTTVSKNKNKSEVLRSLRHYPQAQRQGHNTIDWRRKAYKEELLDELP